MLSVHAAGGTVMTNNDLIALLAETKGSLARHVFGPESPACVMCGGESGFDVGRVCPKAHDYNLLQRVKLALEELAEQIKYQAELERLREIWMSVTIYRDTNNTLRFRKNEIVAYLMDQSTRAGVDMHDLAQIRQFSEEDWKQFTQLLGFSLRGWGEFEFVTSRDITEAEESVEGKDPRDARISALEKELESITLSLEALKKPIAKLFGVAEEDLDPRRR
jgi:hypothetical protein